MIRNGGSELEDRVPVVEEDVNTRPFVESTTSIRALHRPWCGGHSSTGSSWAAMELLVMRVMHSTPLLQQWQSITSLLSVTSVRSFEPGGKQVWEMPWVGEKKKKWFVGGNEWPWERGKQRGVGCWSIAASARQPITPWLKVAPRSLKGQNGSLCLLKITFLSYSSTHTYADIINHGISFRERKGIPTPPFSVGSHICFCLAFWLVIWIVGHF